MKPVYIYLIYYAVATLFALALVGMDFDRLLLIQTASLVSFILFEVLKRSE